MPQGLPTASPTFHLPSTVTTRSGSIPTEIAEQEIIFCDFADQFESFIAALRDQFRVTVASTLTDAIALTGRIRPALVITHTRRGDADTLAVCAAAKRTPVPVAVLVTTPDPSAVPGALKAGCDGVLLEPFPPNLFYARVGRLMRDQSLNARTAAALRRGGSTAGASLPVRGSNRFWPDEACPECHVMGVTTFEFHSHRRAWYACTNCEHVWVGRRIER